LPNPIKPPEGPALDAAIPNNTYVTKIITTPLKHCFMVAQMIINHLNWNTTNVATSVLVVQNYLM
jgi:hypothetical protein